MDGVGAGEGVTYGAVVLAEYCMNRHALRDINSNGVPTYFETKVSIISG